MKLVLERAVPYPVETPCYFVSHITMPEISDSNVYLNSYTEPAEIMADFPNNRLEPGSVLQTRSLQD